MIQMQRLQPQLKKLQEKYKGDREKLNTELMAFYKEHDLNPLSGCIPVVAQLPDLHPALQRAARPHDPVRWRRAAASATSPARSAPEQTLHAVEAARSAVRPEVPRATRARCTRRCINTTKMRFLGMDLSISPLDALRIGLLIAIPFLILMALLLASQIIQNRQIQGRSKNRPTDMPSQQQAIMKFLPFMLPVFSITFPAGLGYYYLVQGSAESEPRPTSPGSSTTKVPARHVVIDTTSSEKVRPEIQGDSPAKGVVERQGDSAAGQRGAKRATPERCERRSRARARRVRQPRRRRPVDSPPVADRRTDRAAAALRASDRSSNRHITTRARGPYAGRYVKETAHGMGRDHQQDHRRGQGPAP